MKRDHRTDARTGPPARRRHRLPDLRGLRRGLVLPARDFCPRCGAVPAADRQAAGPGTVHAGTLVTRAPTRRAARLAPYPIVLVDADEGFRMMAHGDPALQIGDRVRARFSTLADRLLPYFEKDQPHERHAWTRSACARRSRTRSPIAVIGASENPEQDRRPAARLPVAASASRARSIRSTPTAPRRRASRPIPAWRRCPRPRRSPSSPCPATWRSTAVDECAARGVKVAIVMTSGFGETADPTAQAKERGMAERARAAGMRMIGPNSQGLANFGTGAVLSFSTMFIEAEPTGRPGRHRQPERRHERRALRPAAAQRGIGVRHVHATGNDCDVTVSELASVVAEDPDLQAAAALSRKHPRSLEPGGSGAHRPRARPAGHRAEVGPHRRRPGGGRSHTGALANEDRVVDAFLEQHGIWRARDIGELVGAAELYLKGWRAAGRRLVAISNSGAVCVMTADAASAAGMPMAPLTDETRAELGAASCRASPPPPTRSTSPPRC